LTRYDEETPRIERRMDAATSFEALVRTYAPEIESFLRRLCGNRHDAEELAQDVFVKAYRKIDTLREAAAARRWLFTIAVNRFNDWVTPRKRRAMAAAESIDETAPPRSPERSPAEHVAADELSRWLTDAVARLPERQRSVVLLFMARGFDYGEIAGALGISSDAVKMSLFHAREKLRGRMERFFES
jgi:RNA polymerase sigma-70 factor, ECF subfamily